MSDRITKTRLHYAIDALNDTFDAPAAPYQEERDENGGLVANAGHYMLDCAYGGYAVECMSEGGGARVIIGRGTARETHDQIQAMLTGAREMQNKITPRFLVELDAREYGAVGNFGPRNVIVRAPDEKAAKTAAVARNVEDGYESRSVNSVRKL